MAMIRVSLSFTMVKELLFHLQFLIAASTRCNCFVFVSFICYGYLNVF